MIATFLARARTGALVLGASAALGLAACGDDGSDEFADSLNTFCKDIKSQQTNLETQIQETVANASREDDPNAIGDALAKALTDLGTFLEKGIEPVADVDDAGDYSDFRDELVERIRTTSTQVKTAAKTLDDIDFSKEEGQSEAAQAFQQAIAGLQDNSLSDLEVPEGLEEDAPECQMGGAASESGGDAEGESGGGSGDDSGGE